MKILALLLSVFILSGSLAFAEEGSNDPGKNGQEKSTSKESSYKSSPRLNYHSNKPEDANGLEGLKPMLNQITGNNQGTPAGGVGMPSGGTYSF